MVKGKTLGISSCKVNEPSIEDIMRIIQGMKSGTSPGTSRLPPEILKHLTVEDLGIIHRLIKYCWKHKSIPEAWRVCAIVLLEKDPKFNTYQNHIGQYPCLTFVQSVHNIFA